MWYKTSNRKPYYDLKTSQRDFFTERVRFLHESNTIESLFEKPYYDLQYNKMHLKGNWPNWAEGGGGGIIPTAEKGCNFVQNPTTDQEIIFSGGVVNLNGKVAAGPFNIVLGSGEGVWYKTCVLCISPECPGYTFSADPEAGTLSASIVNGKGNIRVTGPGSCSGSPDCHGSIPPTACNGQEELVFNITYTNEQCPESTLKEPCKDTRTVPCDSCVATTPILFAWWGTQIDPPTITRNSSIVISISGGTADYSWTVSGTDLWLDAAHTITMLTTSVPNVTVYAGPTTCPGSLSVTDECSNSASSGLIVTSHTTWQACPSFDPTSDCIIGGGSTYISESLLSAAYFYRCAVYGGYTYKICETVSRDGSCQTNGSIPNCVSRYGPSGACAANSYPCDTLTECYAPGQCISDSYDYVATNSLPILASEYPDYSWSRSGECCLLGIHKTIANYSSFYCFNTNNVTCTRAICS